MQFQRRTVQLLHEDHRATIEVIEGLDKLIARARKKKPDTNDPMVAKSLKDAMSSIEDEVSNHFAFEEDELFTRLEKMGDVGIGQHLRDEHQVLLPLGKTVSRQAREALEGGFTDQSWTEFRNTASELIERMFAHIQKEEMALLPALEDLLDIETDMELSTSYADNHA